VDTWPDYCRDRRWQVLLAVLLLGTFAAFHAPLSDMIEAWTTKADYSHGFFVVPVAVYILYRRRGRVPRQSDWPDAAGLPWIIAGLLLAFVAGRYNYVKELSQGIGLIFALGGVLMMTFSRYSWKWTWPALAFLVVMVPMPDALETAFAFRLRQAAAQGSNFILQTLGYPSYIAGTGGTVITIGELRLGVEWACSGLSMVLTFVAVAAAVAILVERHRLDRTLILLSALPIAVIANIHRITVTALVYSMGYHRLGQMIMHDLAGWLMMPLAIGMIYLELKLLDWLFTTPTPPERDDMLKLATETAVATWQMPADGPRGSAR
jgi:exosortase